MSGNTDQAAVTGRMCASPHPRPHREPPALLGVPFTLTRPRSSDARCRGPFSCIQQLCSTRWAPYNLTEFRHPWR